MRKLFLLTVLSLAACTATTEYDANGHTVIKITCEDTVKECYKKAAKVCPTGYTLIKELPPVHTGNYYFNPYSTVAAEAMGYGIEVTCK